MKYLYPIRAKVLIVSNPRQPWTEGKKGIIEAHLDRPNIRSLDRGFGAYYYVSVKHSRSCSSGCVLIEAAIALTS